MKRRIRTGIIAIALSATSAAHAWSRPGHMVTAAMAYRALAADDPKRLGELLDILAAHPDRGAFEVAIDRATGEEKQRRLFYECARWPDDARETAYDHPTWHYSARQVRRGPQPASSRNDATVGAAEEAFALNLNVLNDPLAPKADRAVALCWVMHLVGDIHQPLHTAELLSKDYPDGDRLGSRQYVRESAGSEAVTLHWFWDDRVHRSGTIDTVEAAATRIAAIFPRSSSDRMASPGMARAFASWGADESYPIAETKVYSSDLKTSSVAGAAPAVSRNYSALSQKIAEQRVAQAGWRLAAVLNSTMRFGK